MGAASQAAEKRSDGPGASALAAARDPRELEGALASRRWLRRSEPFPHVVAEEVFRAPVVAELEHDFDARLRAGPDAPGGFRAMGSYDALGVDFDTALEGPFGLFRSRAWHDLVAGVAGVAATGHVSGGLHHHPAGSADGGVHNDLNPGWFPADPVPDAATVALPQGARCRYTDGATGDPGAATRGLVRAVAVLYYLANPPWQPGDGGETGLYRHRDDVVRNPVATVPPRSNSLLLFPCTPFSFHSFLSNRRTARNCLVMWLHRERAAAVAEWGEGAIVPWR